MNAKQHKAFGRLAALCPFDVGNAVGGEILKDEAETDSGHGCVDWYQYRGSRANGPTFLDLSKADVAKDRIVQSRPAMFSALRRDGGYGNHGQLVVHEH